MWTYILKDDFDKYLHRYSQLEEFGTQLSLLETEDAHFLPRLFCNNFPSKLLHVYSGREQIEPERIRLRFNGSLRDYQKPAANTLLEIYNQTGNITGIGKMRPGFGKTVLGVYLASKIKLKTIIIVDNGNLVEQWINSFLNFSSIKEDDIGIVDGKFKCFDKPITIAMTQSLISMMKKNISSTINKIDNNRFGFVMYDEVHSTSASEKFSKVSVLFRTMNVFGLSATPFQFGYHEVMMKNTIGEIIYESNDYELIPTYKMIYYNSRLESKSKYMINRVKDFIKQKAMYNKLILKSKIYLDIIISNTINLYNKGHNVIIICLTEKQLMLISKTLTEYGMDHRKFYGKKRDIDKENDRIIVATYKFVGKGFDMNRLSALILACPLSGRKSLIQVIGRILRRCENKLDPIVIDLLDIDFPNMTLPEAKRKKTIVTNEFIGCEIVEEKVTQKTQQD
jgi:superfamily II DNA or RNA helicase